MRELRPFSSPEELAEAIKHSASQGKWEEVVAIAPLAAKMDGDVLVDRLYNSTKSTDPNIKDGAMIIWSYLNPKNYNTKHIHWGRALNEMMRDGDERAAIWAAVTVCRYVDDVNPHFSQPAREQLERFKARIREMDEREGRNDWRKTRDFVIEKTEERVPKLKDYI